MANIIEIPEEQRVVPLPKATEEKKIYNDSLNMISAGVAFGKLRALVMAGALHNIHGKALWRLEGVKKHEEWLTSLGIDARTDRRYRQIADGMKKLIAERTGTELNESFIFTSKLIQQHFGESIKRDLTVLKLAEASRDIQQFENYLNNDQSGISASTALKLVGGDNSAKPKELSEGGYESQTLFGMHDAILKAGYLWDKERGGYTDKDGNPMTLDEMGEFVDDETGMLIFRETEKVLDKTSSDLVKTIERVSIFFQAYNKKHHSPEFKKLVKDRHREVSTKAKDLLAYVGAMLEGDDDE